MHASSRIICGAIAALVLASAPAQTTAGTCTPVEVSVDTSFADTTVDADDSRGWGQVIQTADTIAVSITFWKAARPDTYPTPAILYVTTVDSTGMPDILNVIYRSPVIGGPFGDGVHPIPLTFTFDPPMTLPKPGGITLM